MEIVVTYFDTQSCDRNTPKSSITHVCEFLREFLKFAKIFFVFVAYRYIVTPVSIEALAVGLLDVACFLNFLETVVGLSIVDAVEKFVCITR